MKRDSIAMKVTIVRIADGSEKKLLEQDFPFK